MKSLTDDADRYHMAFGVYHRLADRTNVMARWVDAQLPNILRDLQVASQATLKVLSIGPGDGEIESDIVRVLRDETKCEEVHVTAVEPDVDMVDKYKARVAADASQQRGVTYDWKCQTLDEYADGNKASKFHFISSVHSIYYLADLPASVRILYDRLEPGGMMLVVLISDQSGTAEFGRRFAHLIGKPAHHRCSADIRAAFEKEGIPAPREFTVRVRCNITPCFAELGAMASDGLLLLDFFTHVVDVVRDAPSGKVQEIRELLGSDRCSERGADGRQVHFNGDWKALVYRR